MNIVCVFGSPRVKGNSAAIANRFLTEAEKLGASVQTFALNKLSYRGCQACMSCKTKLDRCVLKDDLEPVLDAVRDADILVLASPIYYGDITSQMKGFMDRSYSYLKPDYLSNSDPSRLKSGKKLLMILTQGQPDETMFADVFPRYEMFFKWYGFKDNQLIRGCGLRDAGDAQKQENLMKLAENMAKQIVK